MENPYAPPETLDPEPVECENGAPRKRPIGITLLAVLHVLGGCLLSYYAVMFYTHLFSETFFRIKIGMILLLSIAPLTTVSLLVSGIGLWLGRGWGWWIAATYYVYKVFGSTFQATFCAIDLFQGDPLPPSFIISPALFICIFGLLFFYLLRSRVRAYCHIPPEQTVRRLFSVLITATALELAEILLVFL